MGGDNTELLIYRKGMLAGLMLDAAIRRGSHGRRTLDDLSRRLLAIAAPRRNHNVREAELHDAAVALGGGDVERVWARVVTGTELLTEDDVATALQGVTGRSFAPPPLAKSRKELVR
jgi:predicted metalloprotease with PDZ domain